MGRQLSKSELVARLAKKTGITEKTVHALLDELSEIARKEAKNTFTLPGLGTLFVKKERARMGRDARTGERKRFPARQEVRFRVAANARDAILPPRD